jgi:RNA polymerase subunit RPABC4/transcription elongation factor Spt4
MGLKKGNAPPRPRPRRSDYTGERVSVYLPGRQAGEPDKKKAEPAAAGDGGEKPPAAPAGGEKSPASGACPGCGKLSEAEGQFCIDCATKNRVTDMANLISSLKAKEVHMLPAERFLFQARSALAVSAYKDVEMLCAQAEYAAREQEADFEESHRILARCEESIASAIEAGKNTLAAEKAFQKATAMFKKGKYTECMEEAVIVPTLIMDRPRPRIIPAGMAAPAQAGEKRPVEPAPGIAPMTGTAPGAAGEAAPPLKPEPREKKSSPPPEPAGAAETAQVGAPSSQPSTARTRGEVGGGSSGEGALPEAEMARCPSCGERIERGRETCPACGKPAAPAAGDGEAQKPACAKCGELLEPGWRVCPVCKSPIGEPPKEEEDGACPSCGREVLPAWTICPYCDARLKKGGAAMRVRRGFSRPENPAPAIPPALREKGVLAQIEEVDRMLDEEARRGHDVRKARNLLELAVNFTRSGNYDKGERYVRKAKNVAETLLSMS